MQNKHELKVHLTQGGTGTFGMNDSGGIVLRDNRTGYSISVNRDDPARIKRWFLQCNHVKPASFPTKESNRKTDEEWGDGFTQKQLL